MFNVKHYINIFVLFLLYTTIGETTLYGIPATEYRSDLMGHTIKWAAETEKPHRTIYVKIKNPLSAKSMLLNYSLIEEYANEE